MVLVRGYYIPGRCPAGSATYDNWAAWGAAYTNRKLLFNYILKAYNPGIVSSPIQFRFAQKIPVSSSCIALLLDGQRPDSWFGPAKPITGQRGPLFLQHFHPVQTIC